MRSDKSLSSVCRFGDNHRVNRGLGDEHAPPAGFRRAQRLWSLGLRHRFNGLGVWPGPEIPGPTAKEWEEDFR
jgi:hypothetical protein